MNGAAAYWISLHEGAIDDAGTAELVWQTKAGTWASVSGSGLDPKTVQETLERVARTATVGTVAVTSPIQIKGVPASARMRLSQVVVGQGVDGDPNAYSLQVTLTFGVGGTAFPADVTVYPAGENIPDGSARRTRANAARPRRARPGPLDLVVGPDHRHEVTSPDQRGLGCPTGPMPAPSGYPSAMASVT